MIKLRVGNKWVQYVSVEWGGTSTQCSRQLTFTVPSNAYKKDFDNLKVKLGDFVYLYNDKTQIFAGTVTTREMSASIGERTYIAHDFMHHLLRSKGTFKFKNTSPESVTKTLCKNIGAKVGNLAKTNVVINKLFFDEQNYYDMIVTCYKKAKKITNKIYMPTMNGFKVEVIEKGKSSGVLLQQGYTVTDATYTDTLDNMINKVAIYDDNSKKVGEVKNSNTKYGIYQDVYKKEKGVNAKTAAKSLFVGITKEASIEAVGDIRAISGKSLQVKDDASGLKGTFYITSDTHRFENGIHMMSLELAWKNTSEEGADSNGGKATKKKSTVTKKNCTNSSKAYYLKSSNYYHSSKDCSACKGKKNILTSTVAKLKKIKIVSGKKRGKRKYKSCSKCWK